jgi:hypothetical protein
MFSGIRGGGVHVENIVLLSDGTGNSSSKIFKTNVWRLLGRSISPIPETDCLL